MFNLQRSRLPEFLKRQEMGSRNLGTAHVNFACDLGNRSKTLHLSSGNFVLLTLEEQSKNKVEAELIWLRLSL